MPKDKNRRAPDSSAPQKPIGFDRYFEDRVASLSPSMKASIYRLFNEHAPAKDVLKPAVDRARRLGLEELRDRWRTPPLNQKTREALALRAAGPVINEPHGSATSRLGIEAGTKFSLHGIRYIAVKVDGRGSLHAVSEFNTVVEVRSDLVAVLSRYGALKIAEGKMLPGEAALL